MAGCGTFLIRLIGYGAATALCAAIAQYFWVRFGLDQNAEVQTVWLAAVAAAALVPVLCALLGSAGRLAAIFLLFAFAAALLTAPFALAHALG